MRKILVVIDMQNDFTYGALRNDDCIDVIGKVAEKIRSYDGEVIFTRDTHDGGYLETQEGRKLHVPHCIKGSEGWDLVDGIADLARKLGAKIYDKKTFGSMELAQDIAKMNESEKIDEVELVGICTDICVISNAMLIKAAVPETVVKVDSACCAGVTRQSHETALAAMKGVQIEVY